MISPRSLLRTGAAVVALALTAAACSGSSSDASAPLPTIGLGFEFGSTESPGAISGAADATADGADSVDTVVMIGDSITRAATPALYERLRQLGMANVLIQSQNSKRMAVSSSGNPSGVAVADFITEVGVASQESGDSDDALDDDHSNEVWVVALGTNDVDQYSSPDQIAAAVNEMLAAVPEGVPVVWVDTYFRDRADGAAEINAVVAERLERRGNAVLAPWAAFAVTDGVLISDGVHPTESGKDVFAFVVTDTVQAFLDR